jgi:hypothetical protein
VLSARLTVSIAAWASRDVATRIPIALSLLAARGKQAATTVDRAGVLRQHA